MAEVKSICIIGGGSSGWMAALGILNNISNIKVTLIESSKLGNVGVGEATIPFVAKEFKSLLGLNEEEWMKECDATYKSAIRFVNFKSTNKKDIIYHPFFSQNDMEVPLNWWLNKVEVTKESYYNYFKDIYFPTILCQENKFGISSKFNSDIAHNLDASKFGEFCKKRSISKGLNYIDALVVDVTQDDTGIKSVTLDNNLKVEADFFIDASGFKSLLLEKTLGDEFVSIDDILLNNSAIFAQTNYKNKEEELVPYVDCVAKSSGWCWNVPLWSRMGNGYVYSDNFISKDEAEKEFIEHLGNNNVEVNHLKMRVGYHKNPWTKNCVGLPLASGFVEPLESTGLMLTLATIRDFINAIKDTGSYSNMDVSLFNKTIVGAMQDVIDFVLAHYILTDREDTPYWKYIKNEVKPTDSLLEKLDTVKNSDYIRPWDINSSNYGFPYKSWEAILIGFRPSIIRHRFRPTLEGDPARFVTIIGDRAYEMYNEIKRFGSQTDYLKQHIYKE